MEAGWIGLVAGLAGCFPGEARGGSAWFGAAVIAAGGPGVC